MEGNYLAALGHLDRSLVTNAVNTKARNLKSAILRKQDKAEQALELSRGTMKADPLDVWACFEVYLANLTLGNASAAGEAMSTMDEKFRDYVQTWLELSLDYAASGMWEDAIQVLKHTEGAARQYPLVDYYLGYIHLRMNNRELAKEAFRQASLKPADYCFPFRLESIRILETALEMNPSDARACFYLGNLLFEKQPGKAIQAWERSRELAGDFSLTHRNLGWAYYKVDKNIEKAIASYEKAISLNHQDQRLLYELDLVYADGRVSPEKRLNLLQEHHEVIAENNVADALSREVMLLVQLGRYDEALEIAENNYFRQWEGVSKAYSSYVDAYLLRGFNHYRQGRFEQALKDFQSALRYPDNMMVAEPYRGGRSAQVHYYIATAYDALGERGKAEAHYRMSVEKRQNKELSENNYYQALSMAGLDEEEGARKVFDGLIELGRNRLENPEEDFFAKFGERQTEADKKAEAHYLIGLGYLGLKDKDAARMELAQAVELDLNHIWAAALLSRLEKHEVTLIK
jgi:tetratricopeptide (TPR) repeat protein